MPSRTNLEEEKWGKVSLLLLIFLRFQILYYLNSGFKKKFDNFISIPCHVFAIENEIIGKFSTNSLKKEENYFLPCIPHKHELHSEIRKLCLHRHGIQLPWGSWKALHEAYCIVEPFQNNKVGMQVPLWLHLCTEKWEQIIITWKTILKRQQGKSL